MFRSRALAAGACTALAAFVALPATTAVAAPPAPCNNAPQITDATGDGHHAPTDVLSAWWSEANGRLQAVIKVSRGTPVAEHDEAADPGGGYAFVYIVGGETRYVRAIAAARAARRPTTTAPTRAVGGFTSAGPTTGAVESGERTGTVTIDVPAVARRHACSPRPFVDHLRRHQRRETTWVDHAPGGGCRPIRRVGADYVVGSCRRRAAAPAAAVARRSARRPPSSSPRPSASRAARP